MSFEEYVNKLLALAGGFSFVFLVSNIIRSWYEMKQYKILKEIRDWLKKEKEEYERIDEITKDHF